MSCKAELVLEVQGNKTWNTAALVKFHLSSVFFFFLAEVDHIDFSQGVYTLCAPRALGEAWKNPRWLHTLGLQSEEHSRKNLLPNLWQVALQSLQFEVIFQKKRTCNYVVPLTSPRQASRKFAQFHNMAHSQLPIEI